MVELLKPGYLDDDSAIITALFSSSSNIFSVLQRKIVEHIILLGQVSAYLHIFLNNTITRIVAKMETL